jgi:hypothetical protein
VVVQESQRMAIAEAGTTESEAGYRLIAATDTIYEGHMI